MMVDSLSGVLWIDSTIGGTSRTESRRGGCWDRLCGEERIESRVEEESETWLEMDHWGTTTIHRAVKNRGSLDYSAKRQDFETSV